MSDKEIEDTKDKSKRPLEVSSEGNDEDEKRSTRKRARVDYNEDKKADAKSKEATVSVLKEEEDEDDDDDDEIQDVTPANIKSKSEEIVEPPQRSAPRNASDDLMGLPMEPTGLEGGGKSMTI